MAEPNAQDNFEYIDIDESEPTVESSSKELGTRKLNIGMLNNQFWEMDAYWCKAGERIEELNVTLTLAWLLHWKRPWLLVRPL